MLALLSWLFRQMTVNPNSHWGMYAVRFYLIWLCVGSPSRRALHLIALVVSRMSAAGSFVS